MLDRLKQLPAKLLEMWKKLTKRQKIITISSVVGVITALVILIVIVNTTQYEKLMTFEDVSAAKTAKEILDQELIANRLEDDMVTIDVDITKKKDAVLALTDNDLMSEAAMTLADLLSNDISTTSSDRTLKKHLYMQTTLSSGISKFDGVDKAVVTYFPQDNGVSILQPQKEIPCSVMITTNEKFDYKNTPASIAYYVAYSIGNETTDMIKVVDQHGNLIFGNDEETDEDYLNSNLAYKKQVEKWYNDKLFELAIKNGYTDAAIVSALDVNCDKESILFTEYLAGEGLEQGFYDTYSKISSSSSNGNGDIPGTDSNDETDYFIQTSEGGESSYDELTIKYKPSEKYTETVKEWGAINRNNSSLGITLTRVITYSEEDLELQGLLEGTTFEEYVLSHSERTPIDYTEEINNELYELFSDASGIPIKNIKITGYIQPNFIAKEKLQVNYPLILEILLGILIIGLLLFVVFRAIKPEEVVETEPELSVERLLATTKENQSLEDIEFGEKSETRKMIEKYIDENAEAVANLLRNWLNDDGWND